jgi:hypothetical protein
VFRYALDRWRPQSYEVFVYHKGPLGAKEKAALRLLDEAPANLDVRLLDLAGELDEPARLLFAEQEKPVLPWMVVRANEVDRKATVWAGPLREDMVNGLLDSPLRREVVQRILAGETAVWILLESGDRTKDDAAAERLQAELKRLTPLLKLPKLTASPDDQLSAHGPPLRIAFSVLRLKRDDPVERMLVAMLLASEEDLPERKEPMAFAVFGRGHCLAALVGAGINAKCIRKCCSDLLAPCTCDVQGDLARFELLMQVDWKDALAEKTQPLPPAPSPKRRGGAEEGSSDSLPLPEAKKEAGGGVGEVTRATDPDEAGPLFPRQVLVPATGLAALLVVVTGAWAVRSGRRKLD